MILIGYTLLKMSILSYRMKTNCKIGSVILNVLFSRHLSTSYTNYLYTQTFFFTDSYAAMLGSAKVNFPLEPNVDLNVDVVSATTLIRVR